MQTLHLRLSKFYISLCPRCSNRRYGNHKNEPNKTPNKDNKLMTSTDNATISVANNCDDDGATPVEGGAGFEPEETVFDSYSVLKVSMVLYCTSHIFLSVCLYHKRFVSFKNCYLSFNNFFSDGRLLTFGVLLDNDARGSFHETEHRLNN